MGTNAYHVVRCGLGISLIALMSGVTGCGSGQQNGPPAGNSAAQPTQTESTSPPAKSDVATVTPQFTLTSKELNEAHQKDEKATAEKYKNAVIQISGVVKHYGVGPGGDPSFISLLGSDDTHSNSVQCVTKQPEPWAHAAPGQTATVKGRWAGFSSNTALSDCVIIEVSGTPPASLSSEELSKVWQADANAAKEKYQDHYVILTGTLTKKEGDGARLLLKGSGDKPLVCVMEANTKDLVTKVSEGQPVTLIGEGNVDGGQLTLRFCQLITKKPKESKDTPPASEKSTKQATAGAEQPEMAKLQGKWEIIKQYFGSSEANAIVAFPKYVYFEKDTMGFGDALATSYKLTLDPSKDPKQVDLVRLDTTSGEKMPGIYSLQGDKLILYWGTTSDKRPPGLEHDPNAGYVGWHLELKRTNDK